MRNKIRTILENIDDEYKDFWDAMWSGNSIQYRDVLEHYVPQLKYMKGMDQNPQHHPEGDVDVHVYLVIDEVAKYKDKDVSMASCYHDLGKIDTRGHNDKTGYSNYHNHENVSADYVRYYRDFIEDTGCDYFKVLYLVENHMKYHARDDMKNKNKKDFESHVYFDSLSKLGEADRGSRK